MSANSPPPPQQPSPLPSPFQHHEAADPADPATAAADPGHDDDGLGLQEQDAETLDYLPPTDDDQTLLPPAHFAPFFTLVEDAATGEHFHPSVHYVFTDDDPELHTAVFMRALGVSASPSETEDTDAGGEASVAALPPPKPGVKERYVVVDFALDGQSVTSAQALTRDWQIVSTSVGPAPTFSEDASADQAGSLMLRVEGTALGKDKAGTEEEIVGEMRKAAGGDLVAGMEDMLKKFDSGVDVLGKVAGDDVEIVAEEVHGTTTTATDYGTT